MHLIRLALAIYMVRCTLFQSVCHFKFVFFLLGTSSRRPLLPRQSPIGGTDRDDNKYQRRTPAELFSRWTRRFYAPSSRPPWRRTWFLAISGILAFVVFIYLMALLGRGGGNDSLDDSWNNPNPNQNHYE